MTVTGTHLAVQRDEPSGESESREAIVEHSDGEHAALRGAARRALREGPGR